MVLFLLFPFSAYAGSLDSPAAPTDSGSAMYTLEDIYNRLNDRTAATKRAGSFTEPSAGPASTGKTLDDVMDLVDSRAPVEKTGAGDIGGYAEETDEDGTLQKGVTWPGTRFTDNGDTITDNLTGLMWTQDADVGNDCDGADTGTERWNNARASAATCNTNSVGGFTDWRLPNVKELFSLIDFGNNGPALPTGHPFTGVQSSTYWSGTTHSGNTNFAWFVDLNHPGNTGVGANQKANVSHYVWPVRGGQ